MRGAGAVVTMITAVLLLCWVVTASLVLFIYVGSLLLYIVELTVRRMAEYPKGPVLAAGALLGMVGALIRLIEGG
jgi:membrane protein implicated in regulation of membrane protease activity